jgi:long-chain acyl-CoA synthetase
MQNVTFKNRDGEDVTRETEKWVMAPEYSWKSYSEVAAAVTAVGAGLYNKLEELAAAATEEEPMPHKRIGIFAETKAEWAQTAFGAFRHGIPITTVYATLGPDAVAYAMTQTGVSVMVADSNLLHVIASCKAGRSVHTGTGDETFDAHCSSLKTVVYIGAAEEMDAASAESLQAAGVEVIAFEALLQAGKASPVADSDETKPTPDSIANIQYTSGSTGLPKGVVIRHKHLVAGVAGVGASLPELSSTDRYIAYLPLAHILELLAELTLYSRGASVGYATKDTLVASSQRIPIADEEAGIPVVKGDGAVLCPTVMAAVPAIMEKIRRGITAKVQAKGALVSWMFKTGFERKSQALAAGNKSPFWDRLLFDKIRTEALGGRVRMMISGGGPLNKETQQFMNVVFNCPVGQGYGLTESMGAGTVVWPQDREFGLVGPPVQSVDIKLRDWPEGGYFTKQDPPRGEVMLCGGVVADGYYELPEKTASDFIADPVDGRVWFCTGDIGEFNDQGVLRIIDRKKDLVKLSSGEYISLGKIESTMLLCPYITALMAYGDGDATAAVVIATPDVAAVRAKFPELSSVEEMAASPEVIALILGDLKRIAKAKNFPRIETPSKLCLATEEWTPESGLVTASLKLKRKALMDKYRDDLVALYGRGGAAAE